jgi:hypothetical protein
LILRMVIAWPCRALSALTTLPAGRGDEGEFAGGGVPTHLIELIQFLRVVNSVLETTVPMTGGKLDF